MNELAALSLSHLFRRADALERSIGGSAGGPLGDRLRRSCGELAGELDRRYLAGDYRPPTAGDRLLTVRRRLAALAASGPVAAPAPPVAPAPLVRSVCCPGCQRRFTVRVRP